MISPEHARRFLYPALEEEAQNDKGLIDPELLPFGIKLT
jgi:hypothetical protein